MTHGRSMNRQPSPSSSSSSSSSTKSSSSSPPSSGPWSPWSLARSPGVWRVDRWLVPRALLGQVSEILELRRMTVLRAEGRPVEELASVVESVWRSRRLKAFKSKASCSPSRGV
eukprot:Gregarina_sp_Pseudo_9__2089@NODE_2453_length_990_cov_8_548896_g2256_i0_p3_GENE_NODE_2453_length_990_cov_8_548896_g2256_i0NODE_2453_length_990_cov_8_548896_g2256_i0_p3_ORF_typecomplete_len114_score11_74Chorion_2/PF03964_15/0_43_NODE_2453_length_990_cov_8_548896_g2256_i0352693